MRRLICAFVVRIWQKQVFSQMFFSVIPAIRGGCPGLGRQVEQNQCTVWCVDRRTETLGLSGGYLYWQCRYQTPAACGNFKIPGVSGWRFLKNFISQRPGAVARSDAIHLVCRRPGRRSQVWSSCPAKHSFVEIWSWKNFYDHPLSSAHAGNDLKLSKGHKTPTQPTNIISQNFTTSLSL